VSRFSEPQHAAFRALNDSLSFDWRLGPYDVQQSRAHAGMLAAAGIISDVERDELVGALDRVERELADGAFPFADGDEDIHMAIERRVTELAGRVGGKLHTARSRNDQVATDVAMFVRAHAGRAVEQTSRVAWTLVDVAERHLDWPMPGYTHLQRAQPVSLAHHLLAHVEMLSRDRERFAETRRRAAVSPLGSGALAGSTLRLDREAVARELGLSGVTSNSLDAVSDRDAAVELVFDCALAAVHLSRLGEEIVLWTTREFGFLELDDSFATGSSLMPQKKNPDVAELARGRAGRAIGDLTGLLATLKGLPLSYNRDLQEDKRPLLGAPRALVETLEALAGAVETARFDVERMGLALGGGEALATDVAEYLVSRGVPFREAHEAVGRAAALASRTGRALASLTAAEWKGFHAAFGRDVARCFDPGRSLSRRELPGAPGPRQVARQIARWERELAR